MSTKDVWSVHLLAKLAALNTDSSNADVIVKVGEDISIPAYSWILKLNSSLMQEPSEMTVTEPDNIVPNQKLVYLEPEFGESEEIVRQIFSSFHTGEINVERNLRELKILHKFALMYHVEWLLELTLKKLSDLAEADIHTLIELYKFASSIFCESLKKRCLDKIDTTMIDEMTNNYDISLVDYDLVREISLSKNSALLECKKFELVRKWHEYDTEGRKGPTSQLIKNINFNSMSHADCRGVADWIFESDPIDDSVCLKVAKAIHLRQKGLEDQNANVIMEVITDYVRKKGTDNTTKELSAEEVLLCAREVLGGDNEEHKDDICVYLADHRERLITKQSVVEFMSLLNNCTSKELSCKVAKVLMQNVLCERSYWTIIVDADWRHINYEAMIVILHNIGIHITWEYKLPIVMRWSLENQGYLDDASNQPNVINLLSSVCLEGMPFNYRDTVLSTYLKNTFLSRDVQLTNAKEGDEHYRCSVHKGRRCADNILYWNCKRVALPANFYSLKEDAKLTITFNHFLNIHLELVLKIKEDPCLTLLQRVKEKLQKKSFILFDKDSCMDRYPVPKYSYTMQELRHLFAKYTNLHVFVYKANC